MWPIKWRQFRRPWVAFKVVHLLQVFSNGIFHTAVQQLTKFELTRVARSLCERLVDFILVSLYCWRQHYCVDRPFKPPPTSFKPLFDNLFPCGEMEEKSTYRRAFQPPRKVSRSSLRPQLHAWRDRAGSESLVMSCMRVCRKQALSRVKCYYY